MLLLYISVFVTYLFARNAFLLLFLLLFVVVTVTYNTPSRPVVAIVAVAVIAVAVASAVLLSLPFAVAVSAVRCCCRHVSCVMIISWSLMFQLVQLIWCVEELSIAR